MRISRLPPFAAVYSSPDLLPPTPEPAIYPTLQLRPTSGCAEVGIRSEGRNGRNKVK
jgi:hypothetical protein